MFISPHHPQKIPEDLKAYAREMRKKMPDAEELLWYLIRNRKVAGAKFRRQHPVGRYILDFYCVEKKLAVELDGGQHSEQQTYDQTRDAYLSQQGIHVLRFWNNQMLLETEVVLEAIYLNLSDNNPSLASDEFQMLGRGEGG
ncbi:endonuclease domain-containing protein [Undibacterium sp. LX15W]|uniref:Endonuclease domain-containing protein n=2 Tax=Undibacterium flavidum TaxID=2762297 RepID=A0ABR6YAI7_9BURK|nr:endonuclease domain-containing protein [Undibacterium flavidum]